MWSWFQAARPVAYPAFGVPLLLGHFWGFLNSKSVNEKLNFDVKETFFNSLVIHSIGFVLMAIVLFWNDYADEDVDRVSKVYFLSGGSRVIPQGKLTGQDLLKGSFVLTILLFLMSLVYSFNGYPYLPFFCLLVLFSGYLYSMEPFRFSFKGYGELLQGITLGLFLPLLSYYFISRSLDNYPYLTVLALFPNYVASNITTAIPDIEADRIAGRKSWAASKGEVRAKIDVIILHLFSTLAVIFASPFVLSTNSSFVVFILFMGYFSWITSRNLIIEGISTSELGKTKEFVLISLLYGTIHCITWIFLIYFNF